MILFYGLKIISSVIELTSKVDATSEMSHKTKRSTGNFFTSMEFLITLKGLKYPQISKNAVLCTYPKT